MITQQEFVADCYLNYAIQGLEPGNPEHGEWHKAHYPVPKCLGGTDCIWLLEEHHAIQGILQSIECQHPCIYGWEKKYITGEWEYLLTSYAKWMTVKSQRAATANLTPELRESRANLIRNVNGKHIKGTKWWTDGINEVRQVESPGEGWWNGRSQISVKSVKDSIREWIKKNPEKATERGIKGGSAPRKRKEKKVKPRSRSHRERWAEVCKNNPKKVREMSIKGAAVLHSIRVQCTVTGKISTPGGLTQWQKKRGIGTSNRIRLE